MDQRDSLQPDELYRLGLTHFREGRWEEAIAALSQISDRGAYPEISNLISDAQLKLELARIGMPATQAPKRKRRSPLPIIAAVVAVLLLAAGGAYALIQPSGQPAPTPVPTSSISLPTRAPTSTPTAVPTRAPTITPRPSPTPEPTPEPTATAVIEAKPGLLTVRTPDGQSLTRTTNNIAIILDASGSMLANLGGKRKIDIARDALGALITQIPDSTNIALRAYGHRRSSDCADTQLIEPLARLDREKLTQQIQSINPSTNGRTPIGLSLQEMAKDLGGVKSDTLIVLVTDGEETCDANPAAIAAELRAANPLLRIAVIGFSLDEAKRGLVTTIAESGGGAYFDAADAGQLTTALRQAIVLAYRVFDKDGKEVFSGTLGQTAPLPVGSYRVVVGSGNALEVSDVQVTSEAETVVEVTESGGSLKGSVVGAP